MARYFGKIGYLITEEKTPGVWSENIVERSYYGDIIQHGTRWQSSSDKVNDDILVTNEVSILADPYAYEHFSEMRYIEFMGANWKISSIQVERPRLTITLGGLWNGQ